MSHTTDIDYGDPQGRIPDPVLFYIFPLGDIIGQYDIRNHCYCPKQVDPYE